MYLYSLTGQNVSFTNIPSLRRHLTALFLVPSPHGEPPRKHKIKLKLETGAKLLLI